MRLVALALLFVACEPAGAEPCPFLESQRRTRAQLCTDRESLAFNPENSASGTRIGEDRINGLGIRNGGRETLRLTTLNVSGDLDVTLDDPPKLELDSFETVTVTFHYRPTKTGVVNATLHLVSNAENAPMKDVSIWGCGVPADAGTVCVP